MSFGEGESGNDSVDEESGFEEIGSGRSQKWMSLGRGEILSESLKVGEPGRH